MPRHTTLQFDDIDLSVVHNRNESRVLRRMTVFFQTHSRELLTDKDLCDIFALTLNFLPARYSLRGNIVLGDTVRDVDVDSALLTAYDRVRERPKD